MTIEEILVETCERLLTLLTGKFALQDEAQAAALEAIELLAMLESALKCRSAGRLPMDWPAALAQLKHREQTLQHVAQVLDALKSAGYL